MPNSDARPGAGRSAKDRAIIALLVVVIIALLCGIAYGANYLMHMYADNSAAVDEAASRVVPKTPDELSGASDASSASGATAAGQSSETAQASSSDAARTSTEAAQGGQAAASTEQACTAQTQGPTDTTQPATAQSEQGTQGSSASQPADDSSAQAAGASSQTGAASDEAPSTSETPTGASASSTSEGAASTSSSTDASVAVDPKLPDNPIDFVALQKENADIYAWLYIPNTGINLPVLQNPFDDSYYLSHDAHREENLLGAVYSQISNKKDFSDPVTVLYGHDGEAQFKNLHYFEDEKFFQENDKMYVYTTGHIYTYRIVSAYKSDNRHILNTHDFTKQDVLQGYFDSVLNPDSLLLNVRQDVALDAAKDKIIQLSTCMLDEFHGSSRYIVTGVLIDDQPTKQ